MAVRLSRREPGSGDLGRMVRGLVGFVSASIVLSACQGATPPLGAGTGGVGSPVGVPTHFVVQAPVVAPRVVSYPAQAARNVRLDAPVSFDVTEGTIAAVTTSPSLGAGSLLAGGGRWLASAGLRAGTTYTVTAQVRDASGRVSTHSTRFTTMTPGTTSQASVTPSQGQVVGVGMPVIVQFGSPVVNRAAVAQALQVRTKAKIVGAWHWVSATQLQWRPETYWPAGTAVRVTGDLRAVELRKGVWGAAAVNRRFSIGSAMISTVDVKRHTLTVRRDGKVLKVIPITTGKPGFLTRNGVKVIMTKEYSHQMDAATTGISKSDPNYYNILVYYAMRLTNSGEFLHAAPWSVGSQGHANVSHGCTGMSTSLAAWLYDRSKIGDVVEYTNSPRPMEPGNGWGLWNLSFSQWAA